MSANSKKVALMVAGKPSAAYAIQECLGRGLNVRKIQGTSKYNLTFEFDYKIQGKPYLLRITSVYGQVMRLKFPESRKNWKSNTDMEQNYTIGLDKVVIESAKYVVKNLEN